jgi:hypothetical protein
VSDLTGDPMPLTPEQWAAVVTDTCAATGHGDEIIVAVETTMSGWRVTVNPVTNPTAPEGPVSE